jgi:hypothetical protein
MSCEGETCFALADRVPGGPEAVRQRLPNTGTASRLDGENSHQRSMAAAERDRAGLAGLPAVRRHPRSLATGPAIGSPRLAREITDATAGVHRGAWQRGGVAGGGAGAAGRPRAAHRGAHVVRRKRSRDEASPLCVQASACRLGLDRWPQHTDGPSLGRRRHQSDTSARAGVGRRATRRHPGNLDRGDRCPPAGDPDDPDRLCDRGRPRRQWHRH